MGLGKKKILVTGGAGYIGSQTVRELQKAGFDVLVLDNLSTGSADSVNCQLIVGDLADAVLLDKIFAQHNIGAVVHFAGSIIVEESVLYPEKYFQNNVVNGLNLLNVMVRHGVKKIIFSSSAAVYGEPERLPISETSILRPTNPYGETKLMFEKILGWYGSAHELSSVSLRYFNACGASLDGTLGEKRPFVTHLIPKILRVAARQDEMLKIYGSDYNTPDGTAVRDYIHVVDLAAAHVLALKKLDEDSGCFTYNVGTGVGYSVKQMVDAVMEVTGKMVMIEYSNRRPGDPAQLMADVAKIKQDLNFSAQYSDLNTIVSTAWNWHKVCYNIGYDKTLSNHPSLQRRETD
ncbi:MAG: UDP-glucose 4-epimerase GalE [Candidatus Doudnabacteria bacterium RIFCSPHIGHO2_12_FULL_48_11]|uniref:UDP-glucose 4-epimerase n=1 Tax=Candidatus Doudnabacteria bacterium RIFCSPHIGHO2_01_FULL_46_24 TaxID=1817825 RepID=A0A1F5NUJ6_9BACT|nr:MAG: UDP-glucose 4-epimerase GalE [Candidatus Doudnabacteria bacterium RIFCSPHIGHO2_01_FULL_46_24]OGE95675.1 MAG: UDP-glucose 4-epimerase GalE [Candidatus Doudnabacteria bacterium RIFCSPHIGHO2_12_FULL_48_11]